MGFIIEQNINLLKPDKVEQTQGNIAYSGDSGAHIWKITVSNAGALFAGNVVNVLYILPNGTKFYQAMNDGISVDGNVVNIEISRAAYTEVGIVTAFAQAVNSDRTEVTTFAVIRFGVNDAYSGTIHVPSDVILPISEIMRLYREVDNKFDGIKDLPIDEINTLSGALVVDKIEKTISPADGYSYAGMRRMQCGSINVGSINGSGGSSQTIQYSGFATPPIVQVSCGATTGNHVIGMLRAITATSATVAVRNLDGSNASGVMLYWVAIAAD